MSAPHLGHLFHPDNARDYTRGISEALDLLVDKLDTLDGPTTGLSPEVAAKPVDEVDLDTPLTDGAAALAEVSRLWLDDAVWFHDPSYAAHLNCPVVIPALVGELLMSAVNTSMDTFDQSVGATFMERRLVDWTAARAGYPEPTRDGIFTSGGSQSNLQALLLARGEAERRGVPVDRLRFLTSADSHFSIAKSARLLGMGEDAAISVPTDADHRMDVAALRKALDDCVVDGLVPAAVVATAGTTDFGVIDPLHAIAEACQDFNVWFHVDAAYGGGLLVSPRYRHLLDGIERSDSVTVDYHKTWFQPVSSSALLVRDRASLQHASWYADYLNPRESENPNQVDKSLQTTRRFDALKLWLTLRTMGADQIGAYLESVIDLAREVYDVLSLQPDIELVTPSQLSTVVFRYADPHLGSTGLDDAAVCELNRRIRAEMWSGGRSVVAATKVDGRQFLKLTLLNPKASLQDILDIIEQVRTLGLTLGRAVPEVAR
ncbi:L-2,4-diaminobutyrate decarboxylase [Nocardioides albertanoniae]|uniref:L-2,4-diaminobutyrate decarboxylase n=1 Tax=Nocardioides albertanoniae TaxID=1175486 RepID=A0A543A5T2_9ACTN|nr:aspartate aminotransferase family protein [Nocardioides albertanoniae]TQL67846.1 L-2,4-diaminobutyrate decarboxylase [Nocardioides albertanoniae]